jgi:hypothetical protein
MLCSEIEKTHPDPDCPNADQHTPHPAGYIQHSDWAESMLTTHRQQRCEGCGNWNIWTPKGHSGANTGSSPSGGPS